MTITSTLRSIAQTATYSIVRLEPASIVAARTRYQPWTCRSSCAFTEAEEAGSEYDSGLISLQNTERNFGNDGVFMTWSKLIAAKENVECWSQEHQGLYKAVDFTGSLPAAATPGATYYEINDSEFITNILRIITKTTDESPLRTSNRVLTASFKDRAYIEASNGMFLEHPVRAKKKSSILMSEFGFYYHYLKLHHLVLYYAHDGSAKIMSHEA